jgi:hypothetical protein
MKNFLTKNKTTLILCAVFFSFIIFSNSARASILYEQPVNSVEQANQLGSSINWIHLNSGTKDNQHLEYAMTGTFNKIQLKATSQPGTYIRFSYLNNCTNRNAGQVDLFVDGDTGGSWSNPSANIYEYSGFTAINLDDTKCYFIQVQMGGTHLSGKATMEANGEAELCVDNGMASNCAYDNNVGSAYYQLCTDGACTPPPPSGPSISLLSPVSTTTPIYDFATWSVAYDTTTSTSNGVIEILYDTTTTTLSNATSSRGWVDSRDIRGVASNSSSTFYVVPKYGYLQPGTYYARAFLEDNACPTIGPCLDTSITVLASTTISSFVVAEGFSFSGGYFPIPTSTATSSDWVITCDDTSGLFQNSLCLLGAYLFSPKYSDIEQFQDIYIDLQSKPPFGYFNAISGALNQLSTSTATSTYSIPDWSDTFLGPLRTSLSWILYIIFAFWIFHTFRKIQL